MKTHMSDVGREDSRAGGAAMPSEGWGWPFSWERWFWKEEGVLAK